MNKFNLVIILEDSQYASYHLPCLHSPSWQERRRGKKFKERSRETYAGLRKVFYHAYWNVLDALARVPFSPLLQFVTHQRRYILLKIFLKFACTNANDDIRMNTCRKTVAGKQVFENPQFQPVLFFFKFVHPCLLPSLLCYESHLLMFWDNFPVSLNLRAAPSATFFILNNSWRSPFNASVPKNSSKCSHISSLFKITHCMRNAIALYNEATAKSVVFMRQAETCSVLVKEILFSKNNLYYAFVDVHGWYYNLVNLLAVEDKLNVMRIMCKLGSYINQLVFLLAP